jgi:hypothetical protein
MIDVDELRLRRMTWREILALDDPPDSESARWERDATRDW